MSLKIANSNIMHLKNSLANIKYLETGLYIDKVL